MKNITKKLTAFLVACCLIAGFIPSLASAASFKISYNGKTQVYDDLLPKIVYNGKTISIPNSPALIMNDIAMVPYYEVFVKNGPKAKKIGYSSETKQLVLSLNDTRIVLTLNSTTAYVNGEKKILPIAPVSVTYQNTNTSRILVPSRAICSIWGIDYSWSKAKQTVSMNYQAGSVSNSEATYYKNSKAYKAKICSVSFEGNTLPLASTPALTIQKYNMIPYYAALCKNGPKAKRSYNSKTKVLKLSYQSNILTMKVGSKTADINGETITLPIAPFFIKYTKNGKNTIMVPAKAVALYLGIHYNYTSDGRAISLEKALSIKYDKKYYCYTGKQNKVSANGITVKTSIPSINIGGIPYLPVYYPFQDKYGLGVSYSYKSKRATLDNGFHKVVLKMESSTAQVDGKSVTMPGKARLIRLTATKKNYVMAPAEFLADALELKYSYGNDTISLMPSEQTGMDSTIPASSNTVYNDTLNAYASKQKKKNDDAGLYKSVTLSQYISYLDPAKDTTDKFQFLRLDTYRPIVLSSLSALLAENGKGGVLEGKASAINNAAKRYKLDPVYFAAQCIHETGWGKSTLAKGITSNEVAVPTYNSNGEITGFAKDSKTGKYKTKKLDKSYTAYNLFGIKAYDDAAQLCGFSYAYYSQWFTVEAAIEGGAEYISKNYVHSSVNNQNTIYKFRFHPTDLNHQYATDPQYAIKTANYIKNYSNLYHSSATFQYEYPSFAK